MGPSSPDVSVAIATYNLHHGVGSAGRYDLGAMLDACGSLDVDVLALQEIDRRSFRTWFCNQPRRVAEATGLLARYAACRHLGPLGSYGLALLTRWTPSAVEVIRLPPKGHRQRAIVADVEVPGTDGTSRSVTFASTHLYRASEIALGQLEYLLERLVAGRDPHQPIVLAGDLNGERDLVVPRLLDAGFVVAESGPTFPARDPQRRLDWLAGRHVAFVDAVVPALTASDHRPLVATGLLGRPAHGPH